jgi:hypothetical protein
VERLNLRRQTDELTYGYPIPGLRALAVETNLPCAQQLFELAMCECRVMAPEPAVEARPVVICLDIGRGGADHCAALAIDAGNPVT